MSVVYSILSIVRHWHFSSRAYDLGIFDQVIWLYSRFQPPLTTIRNNLLTENILGDHFHPILVLLAPLYWFTDKTEALLVVQAFLFAISVVPIFLFVEKRLNTAQGWLLVISYSIFWGVQKAIEHDFHEVSVAVPLIAFAIYFIDERKRKSYFFCLCLLLLTKENLSILVGFFGFYLITLRQFTDGLIILALGFAWFFAAINIFIPFFGHHKQYEYWSYTQFGSDPLSALKTIVKDPLLILNEMTRPTLKLRTCWYIFSPFLFQSFLSPLIILMVPLLAERFLSNNPLFWSPDFHYTATIAPILVMTSADGLNRLKKLIGTGKPGRICISVICTAILMMNLYWLYKRPLWSLTRPGYWQFSQSERTGYTALSLIPPKASVAAQANLVPHLSHRRRIYMLRPGVPLPDDCEFIVTSTNSYYPFNSFQEIEDLLVEQQANGYRRVFVQDGWVVLKRTDR